MTIWDRFREWVARLTLGDTREDLPLPEYDRPYVRRTTAEEQRRAEQAVRTLEAYVRAQSARRDDPRGRR